MEISLSNYLAEHPIGVLVPGVGAIFSDYDAVIPDLVFVRNERWLQVVTGEKFTGAPDLVIEVLSPGAENRRRDLLVKRQLYGKYGVSEYWVIEGETRAVEVYRLQEEHFESVARFSTGDEISTPLLPAFRLSVSALFKL